LGTFGGARGGRGLEGDAVNGDGGGEARIVIGAFSGGVVGGQGPRPSLAKLLHLRFVHFSHRFAF